MKEKHLVDQIKQHYDQVIERVKKSAQRAGREPGRISIVVVTKTHPVEVLTAALQAGIRKLGENYAEEAVSKMDKVAPVEGLEWHMIGHIQSRKAALVSQRFQMVHSLDSVKLASRLDRFAAQESRVLSVLLECNTSGESSKYGWNIEEERTWSQVIAEFTRILDFSNLEVRGLMTMAPYTADPETVRPFFRKLREFQQVLVRELPVSDWDELSMGMSGDYEVAIEEGATFVRIGQAILGPRH